MLNIDLSLFSVLPEAAAVGGVDCVVLRENPRPDQARQSVFFLDPNREFVPLRFVESVRQKPFFQIELRFRSDTKNGIVPDGWTIVYQDDNGGIKTSQVAKVTSFAINDSISNEKFEIEFPPGTWVRDLRSKNEYIVRPDYSRRHITAEELRGNFTYEQLLSSDPGRGSMRFWFVSLNVVLVLVVLAIIILRRLRNVRAS